MKVKVHVFGEEIEVEADPKEPLFNAAWRALKIAQIEVPRDRLVELRDQRGVYFGDYTQESRSLEAFGIKDGDTLYLTYKIGSGG